MKYVFFSLCLFALFTTAMGQTFTSTGDAVSIADGIGTIEREYGSASEKRISVSGLNGTIDSLSVSFNARHPFVGELQVALVSPQGQEFVLFDATGATDTGRGSPANLVQENTHTFSDLSKSNWWTVAGLNDDDIPTSSARAVAAGGSNTTSPPATTSMLSVFQRRPANGTWILRFRDGWKNNLGAIRQASLTFGMSGVTHRVTKAQDTNDGACNADCSLREAILASSSNVGAVDLIEFVQPLFSVPTRIALNFDLEFGDRSVAIVGPGTPILTISGRGQHQLRLGAPDRKLSLSGLRLSDTMGILGGFSDALLHDIEISHLRGQVEFSGVSEINDSSIHSNRSQGSVLKLNAGTLRRSTVSSNVVFPNEIQSSSTIWARSTLRLIDCSIVGNRVSGYQATGGVFVLSGNFSPVQNTVIADNRTIGDTPYADIGGPTNAFQSLGYNFIGNAGIVRNINNTPSDQIGTPTNRLDPMLGPLSRNGSKIPTHAPLRGSPLLDQGVRTGRDVRGVPVVDAFGAGSWQNGDIGAVEINPRWVLHLGDSGDGSLREALDSLSFGVVIDILFPLDLPSAAKITLTSGELVINQDIAIHGPGARRLTISGNGSSRVLAVKNDNRVSISGLSLTDGNGLGTLNNGVGGILLTRPGSQVSIVESELRNAVSATTLWHNERGVLAEVWGSTLSQAEIGLSVFGGELNVVSSTIATSKVAIFGSGPVQTVPGFLYEIGLRDSTLSGALSCSDIGRTFIKNTILDSHLGRCLGLESIGHNLVRSSDVNGALAFLSAGDRVGTESAPIALRLSPLAYHGGPVATRVPLAGSPALDGGMRLAPMDARRQARFDIADINPAMAGDNSDIGAVEVQALFVKNTTDQPSFNPGSLRQAMLLPANNSALFDILFDVTGTILLSSKLPAPIPNSSVNLLGSGADRINVRRANGAPAFGLLDFVGPGHLSISGISMSNGLDDGSDGQDGVGGALEINGPDVFLTEVEFFENRANQAGAVSIANSEGVIQSSTFAVNSATTNAGALQILGSGKQFIILDSTFSQNTATQHGAITHISVKTPSFLEIESVTLANNTGTAIGTIGFSGGVATTSFRNSLLSNASNLSTIGIGHVISRGFNLSNTVEPFFSQSSDRINVDPLLGPLQNNAGRTRTHALLAGSAAVDAGIRTGFFDQRGEARASDNPLVVNAVGGDGNDIGSVEVISEALFLNGFE